MNIICYLQGERRGMGSELVPPRNNLLSLLHPSIVIPQTVLLADVSFYQDEIDFVKMKAAGVKGVIIRAGQRSWIDPMFSVNWQKAKEAGLMRGSYWFYDSRETPERQAALWYGLIKNDPGELVHVPDLEERYGGAYGSKAHFKTFVNEFQRLSLLPDKDIAIYTGFYWWLERVGNDVFFSRFRLWLAWYSAMEVVRVPVPWTSLFLWQFTSSGDGLKYGVSSKEIDLNWYNGTPEQFAAEFGGDPPIGGSMKYGTVNTSALNLRNGPGASYLDIGDLLQGDKVQALEVLGGWWHLVDATRNGQPVLTSDGRAVSDRLDCWASGSYILETAAPEPVIVFEPFDLHYTLDGVPKVQRYNPE